MNVGSVLNRLSPVQGTYRRINYEYQWVQVDVDGLTVRGHTQQEVLTLTDHSNGSL